MAKLAGKAFRLKISTTSGGAGTYTAAIALNSVSMKIDGTTIDVSEFVNTYKERLQGLKDVSYDVKGFYNSADSTGQAAIISSLTGDSEIWCQFLPNGSTGWKQQIIVSNVSIDAEVDGAVGFSCTIEGNGALATV